MFPRKISLQVLGTFLSILVLTFFFVTCMLLLTRVKTQSSIPAIYDTVG